MALILGIDASIWASSTVLKNVTPQEAIAVVRGFDDGSSVLSSGITLGGTRYITLRADERIIIGRKGTSDGLVALKANQVVLIGFWNETMQSGLCFSCVEKLAEYLDGFKLIKL